MNSCTDMQFCKQSDKIKVKVCLKLFLIIHQKSNWYNLDILFPSYKMAGLLKSD